MPPSSSELRGARHLVVAWALLALLLGCTAPDGSVAPASDPTRSAPASSAPASSAPASPAPAAPAPDSDARVVDTPSEATDTPPLVTGPEPLPPVPPGRDALIARLSPLVGAAAEFSSEGTVAVLVTDEHGREVVGSDADTSVMPASTQKLLTAAAVLVTLGPDGRLRTHLETTGPIGPDGVLEGEVVVVGAGDPTLVTDEYARWIYPARPRTPLEDLADALVEAGVRVIAGDVVADVSGFVGDARAEGWQDNYFHDLDARYVSGLTVDAGLETLITLPEPDEAEEDDDSDEGQEPAPAVPDVRVQLVPDPALHTVRELERVLEERGVRVEGEPRVGEPTAPPVGRLVTVHSPPMHEVLRFAVQRSDNHLSDQLFLVVGRLRTGEGSWPRGERGLRQVLDHLGVDHTGARFADGSGLSRDDRVTPRLLVELDRAMLAGRHADTWRSLMAVMGESGTLSERMRGTVAVGRFVGKTGTLRDVTALSGAVLEGDEPRFHLAVLANDPGGGRWAARVLMDELILALVAEVDGCEIRTLEGIDATPLGVPPSTVSCP